MATNYSGSLNDEHDEGALLIVDDEENILKALVRVFRRDGYRVLTASSGEKGLEALETHKVNVILSDMRMPNMNGVEFLNRVKETHPDTIRIVLSGYTDLDFVTEAINRGAIYKFLTKPWDDELLRENIRKAFHQYDLEHNNACMNTEIERMSGMLNGLVIGILDVGEDGRMRAVNTKAAEILGLSVQEIFKGSVDSLPRALGVLISHVASERSRGSTELAANPNGTVVAHAVWYESGGDGRSGGVAVTLDSPAVGSEPGAGR